MNFLAAIKQAHYMLAIGLGAFILIHLGVHLTAVLGPQQHNQSLKMVQWIYRNPIVEPVLVLAILLQAATGLRLLARKWTMPNKGFWGWAQLISGLTLTWFIIQHTAAALISRHLIGLDTNFFWVAGPLQNPTMRPVFIPYYFLLAFGVFAHIGAYAYFKTRRNSAFAASIVALGAIVSTTIVATFSGAIFPITIPSAYTQAYEAMAKGRLPSRATTR